MKNKILYIIIGVIVAVGILIIICFSSKSKSWDSGLWQAIFLTNNQVYFGKIEEMNRDTISLSHIYYLQASDSLSTDESSTSKLNLIKLGSEIHGPEDMMMINKSNVLFWENLKNDSKIVNIINNYK